MAKVTHLSYLGIASLTLAIAVMLSSCVTYNKCLDKYGVLAKPVKMNVDVPIDTNLLAITSPDSIEGEIKDTLLDSLRTLAQDNERLNDTLTQVSESGKLKIKFWYDQYTKALKYKGTKRVDTVFVHLKDTVSIVVDCPPCVVFDKDKDASGLRRLWLGYQLFAAWALLIFIGLVLYHLSKKLW